MSYFKQFLEEQEAKEVEPEEIEDVEYLELPTEHIEDEKIKQKIERMNKLLPSSIKLKNMEEDLGLIESRLKRSQTCRLLIKKLEILIPIYIEDEKRREKKRKERQNRGDINDNN